MQNPGGQTKSIMAFSGMAKFSRFPTQLLKLRTILLSYSSVKNVYMLLAEMAH